MSTVAPVCYRMQDGCLWKQQYRHDRTSSVARLIAQRPLPLMLDSTRSFDEVVFTTMLRDFFAEDKLAELQASVMGSRIVKLFPNKRRNGNWTISETDLSVAVTEALVRHKLAMSAPIEIEYLGGMRLDTVRQGQMMSSYRRDNKEFRESIAKRAVELKTPIVEEWHTLRPKNRRTLWRYRIYQCLEKVWKFIKRRT